MKRILLLVLLVGVVLALSSCNVLLGFILADKMTLDGEDEYELAEMYLEYYGQTDTGVHMYTLVLISEGIEWGETTWGGNGDVVLVFLASPDRDLADGTYEYTFSTTLDDFDLYGEVIWLGINLDNWPEAPDEWYVIDGGTVDVKKLINDDYLVRMELELEDGETGSSADLELYFQGELADEYDYSSSYSITAPLENKSLSNW